MNAWPFVMLWGLTFAVAAVIGVRLSAAVCRCFVPFEDGPRPGRPPIFTLVGVAAVVGIAAAWQGVDARGLAILLVVTASFAACSYSDVRCGIVPDWFTLLPLALILSVSLAERNFAPAISAAVVLVPFSITAFASRGLGMGWGDVKLASLGAAVLGLQTSLVACTAACLGAVFIAAARGRGREPIAFAPYLAGASALAIVFPLRTVLGH